MDFNKSDIKNLRLVWYTLFIFFILITGFEYYKFFPLLLKGLGDNSAFYLAGKMLLNGQGVNFYNIDVQKTFCPYIFQDGSFLPNFHPPFEALLFALFALLPYTPSYLCWIAFSVILLMVFVRLFQLLYFRKFEKEFIDFKMLFILALAFYPSMITFINGQDSIILLFLFMVSIYLRKTKREFFSGFLIGLSLFKPHLCIPFALGLAVRTKKDFFVGFMLSSYLMFAISLMITGVDGIMGWVNLIDYVNQHKEIFGVNASTMLNVRGVITRHFSGETEIYSMLLWNLNIIVICLINYFGNKLLKDKSKDLLLISISSILTVIFALHLHIHDMVLLLMPILASVVVLEHSLRESKTGSIPIDLKILALVSFLLVTPIPFLLHFTYPKIEIAFILITFYLFYFIKIFRTHFKQKLL